jgi:hypothetical protein
VVASLRPRLDNYADRLAHQIDQLPPEPAKIDHAVA